jgi:serine/threonine-protein kinase
VNDETRLSDDATRLVSSNSGWLTSSGSIDHGRFQPGEILESRYRILGLLGRGGMGEVYRADDLRLGQQVALKFLPLSLGQDPVRLAQFHNEVRTARQVSHPNVCRVYDIGEVTTPGSDQAQLFITMEYVDGEDLSALLRRIGRFPEDKAIEIARQVCAGLAAAHDKGILHRDLKPANIMLDSAGRVRLMDFSLASVGAVTDVRAGTPAYMAPEQLQGREVTVRSDIFALGLVLYELFTGKRVFDAKTVADLVSQHEQGVTTTMSDIVKTIDPAVDRVIARCLDPEPARRPASALAVAAQLSADPLAAALAAGETPSPEMVAAAGGVAAAFSVRVGLVWVAVGLVLLFLAASFGDRVTMPARVPLNKPTVVLVDRALQIREQLGYTDTFVDSASNYRYDGDYLLWAATQSGNPWATLPTGRPAAIRLWHRTSPQLLIPFDDMSRPGLSDPPPLVTGMTVMELDTEGRLLSFYAVPRQVEDPAQVPATVEPDWSAAFTLAGLRFEDFRETESRWTPRVHSDIRRAWEGEWPELPGQSIRVEAAAYRGRIVVFDQVAPWSRATREVPPQAQPVKWISLAGGLIVFSLPLVAGWMAYRNVKAGRGDMRGAMKTATFIAVLTMMTWVLAPGHIAQIDVEMNRFFLTIGFSLFQAALLFSVYLAVEPAVRRLWPGSLVSWSRVTTGHWRRDPLVGRDLLIGATIGLALNVVTRAYQIVPMALGMPEGQPAAVELVGMLGVRDTIVAVGNRVMWAMQNAFIGIMIMAVLRMFIKRQWLVILLVTLFFTIVSTRTSVALPTFWVDFALSAFLSLGILLALFRFGLLASCVMFFVYLTTSGLALTLNSSSQYFASSAWVLALIVGSIGLGYWWARADEPLFGDNS